MDYGKCTDILIKEGWVCASRNGMTGESWWRHPDSGAMLDLDNPFTGYYMVAARNERHVERRNLYIASARYQAKVLAEAKRLHPDNRVDTTGFSWTSSTEHGPLDICDVRCGVHGYAGARLFFVEGRDLFPDDFAALGKLKNEVCK